MSAIVVENLSKRYVIGHQTQADTLRDALTGGVRSLWTRLRRQRQTREEFYALRDVSFCVEPGEVVGIIGRNGAGKSTLLKILSRITEPTAGRIALKGRVASLLEVGTGFHPELSGRENIYLNGAILGMSRAEIRAKFDEIVAFSEVEKFLDTPVKRYSSGMYVRLAFAVAAHLEPEILIVDEVLAVGDAAFQKKCLGKMQDVARGQGRTVLLVSHNMATIQHCCPNSLLLSRGRLLASGPSAEIVHKHLSEYAENQAPGTWRYAKSCPWLRPLSIAVQVRGCVRTAVQAGEPVEFRLTYECDNLSRIRDGLTVSFLLYGMGQKLVNLGSRSGYGGPLPTHHSIGTVSCLVATWPFRAVPFVLEVHIAYKGVNLIEIPVALEFMSGDGDVFGTGLLPHPGEGILLLPHRWSVEPITPPHPAAP